MLEQKTYLNYGKNAVNVSEPLFSAKKLAVTPTMVLSSRDTRVTYFLTILDFFSFFSSVKLTKNTFKEFVPNSHEEPLFALSPSFFVYTNSCYSLCCNNLTITLPSMFIKCISIHGNHVATGGSQDYKINIYDMCSGNLVESYEGLRESVVAVGFNEEYVVASGYREIMIWKRKSNDEKCILGMNEGYTVIKMNKNTVLIGITASFYI